MGEKFLFRFILYLVGKCKQVLFNCFSKLPARQSPFASASISPELFKLNVVKFSYQFHHFFKIECINSIIKFTKYFEIECCKTQLSTLFKLNFVTQLSHPSESEWHSRLEEYLCIHLHWFAQIHKLMNTKFNLAFEKGYETQISHGLYQTLWNHFALIHWHSEVLNWFH